MLKKRLLTALVGLPLLILFIWFDWPLPWFTLFLAVWVLFATREFYTLVGVRKAPSLTVFGLVWSVLFLLSPHFRYGFLLPLLLTSALALSLLLLLLRRNKEGALAQWSWTISGLLYIGWLLSYLIALRIDAGRNLLFFVFFTSFACDTAAFFVGRTLGRHHLAPRISPHKTWEGAAAGVFGAVVIGMLFALDTPLNVPLSLGEAALLGWLVSVFGQLGGLVMSLLKRNVGVKDSGNVIPGHGGLLDRTDSVIFAGLVVYYYWYFVMR